MILTTLSALIFFVHPTLSANIPSLPTGWEYFGCLIDSPGTRVLNETFYQSTQMTIGICVTYCAAKGLHFAGTETGMQCFCGNSVTSFDATSEASCATPCAGDRTQMCGGNGYTTFFRLSPFDPRSVSSSVSETASSSLIVQSSTIARSNAVPPITSLVEVSSSTSSSLVSSSSMATTSTTVQVSTASDTSTVVASVESSTAASSSAVLVATSSASDYIDSVNSSSSTFITDSISISPLPEQFTPLSSMILSSSQPSITSVANSSRRPAETATAGPLASAGNPSQPLPSNLRTWAVMILLLVVFGIYTM